MTVARVVGLEADDRRADPVIEIRCVRNLIIPSPSVNTLHTSLTRTEGIA